MRELFDFGAIDSAVPASDPVSRIAERNRLTERLFTDDVERAGWTLLHRGERPSVSQNGRSIVIGVVLWNMLDRQLLRDAAVSLARSAGVVVVNLDEVHTTADFGALMPGVPLQTETPVVAEYRDGALTRFAAGAKATNLLQERTR